MGKTPPGETRDRVFEFVRERLMAGEPPTVREVQQRFGFGTPQTARYHLEKLVDEGRLLVERGKSRGYRLLEGLATRVSNTQTSITSNIPEGMAWAPLLGQVQAGALTAAIEDPEGYVAVEPRSTADELFALRVRGASMIDAGILPGDLVVVRRQPTAESGEVVVAMVEDEATVKRLHIQQDGASGERTVELHPENPDFSPIRPNGDLIILGKVVEVRRSLS